MKNQAKDNEILVNITSMKNQKKRQIEKEISNKNRTGTIRFLKIFVVMAVLITSLVLFMLSSIFNIDTIEVKNENGTTLSKEDILKIVDIEVGNNIFKFDKRKALDKLEKNQYIASVKINRILPNKVEFVLNERKTICMLKVMDSYVCVDSLGYVYKISAIPENVPVIVGTSTEINSELIEKVQIQGQAIKLNDEDVSKINICDKIWEVAKQVDVLGFISSVDISNTNDIKLMLDSEGKIAHIGDSTNLNAKIGYIKISMEKDPGKHGDVFINMDLNKQNPYFREKL
jgi:cell division protein FtsQ